MASKGVTFGGILVSLALAGLTLAVFAASQLRGPEGSVHKFLIAVAEERFAEVDELSFGTQHEKVVVTRFVSQVFEWVRSTRS